ncbi:phosphate acetyl/butaryl transferase [Caldithrix abyssi DSM 13497]|uniref:Phosphate acetyl/butaryl transferase n=1 Tax=Caldithrix abyssi DSM 13497 TaxID=880073 RepID=H1XW96_CALAY|nr:bifunctional enoyl-CoA hydratase/phosphate acetyltransferase [Caldithrix abyssi]APF19060.1 phosphate butyryltransferase [Caldithrix abyssi DSM 13497]EHO43001.1 phosphate acetyl/butaryl transferase [Caldithrix abyssi DSM 13497]
MLRSFKQLLNQVSKMERRKIAVAMAQDSEILLALNAAYSAGLGDAILVGDREQIIKRAEEEHINVKNFEIVDVKEEKKCVREAVEIVRSGEAQVIMKGLCSTANFLKGILNKEYGLRAAEVLSHLAIFESPNYPKLLMMSDAAMNIAPDLKTKIAITNNAIRAAHALGYKRPKVALLSAVEKVNAENMPSSADAAIMAKMAERGQLAEAIVDGPLALDNALSPKANQIKGLQSAVGGKADICIVPNIEAGNIFYKLMTILGNALVAGVILGAAAPVVLTSRADSENAKFLSIATALAVVS